jgi:branched-chain amino acid transport system substrate-binding protein
MAKFAINSLKARRAAIMFDVNSDYNRSIAKTFRERFSALGGKVIIEQGFAQHDADYSDQLAAIRTAKPDIIYVAGFYQEAAVIAVQARRMLVNQTLLGSDGWDSPQLWAIGGRALDNSYISMPYATDDPSLIARKFYARYKHKYPNLKPDALAALGYDSMMLLAAAIRHAGTTYGPQLRNAIAQTVDFPGITGRITINAERNAVKQVAILKILGGRSIFRENIQPDPEDNH